MPAPLTRTRTLPDSGRPGPAGSAAACADAAGEHSCRRAVQRAWRELGSLGISEVEAFRACTTLYLLRHRTASPHEACDLVAEWLAPDYNP